MVFICHGANAYETSFPFPFEFGHSSDIYLETRKIETKETRQKSQIAQDLLIDKGIKKTPEAFVKYIKKNEILEARKRSVKNFSFSPDA